MNPSLVNTLSSRLGRRAGDERGAAVVEFALVVPLLCLLVLAIFDFARGFNYWLDATHLANEGSRTAAVNYTPASGSLVSYIQKQATTTELRDGTGPVSSKAQVCISFPSGGTPKIGDPVQVTVQATYNWIPFIGGSWTLKGKSTMRLEQLPTYGAGCST